MKEKNGCRGAKKAYCAGFFHLFLQTHSLHLSMLVIAPGRSSVWTPSRIPFAFRSLGLSREIGQQNRQEIWQVGVRQRCDSLFFPAALPGLAVTLT